MDFYETKIKEKEYTNMNVLELSEQEIVLRQCLEELLQMGINPYPADEFPVNAYSTDIRDNFVDGEAVSYTHLTLPTK